jgi:hypothetical protein
MESTLSQGFEREMHHDPDAATGLPDCLVVCAVRCIAAFSLDSFNTTWIR